jgi:uncharacterized low-complexity protein
MTRNNHLKRLSLVTGAALAMSVSAGASAAADVNPFGMTELSQGYQLAGNEAKCGEGKCGGSKQKSSEAKCGEAKTKAAEAKCGEGKAKAAESKCGEGKCGGNK